MFTNGAGSGGYFGIGNGNLAEDVEPFGFIMEAGAAKEGIVCSHGSGEVLKADIFLGWNKLFF
jgi:hypothetical protein